MCYLVLYNSSNNNNNSVFNHGSIYRSNATGPEQMSEKLIQIELNRVSERPAVH